MATASSSRRRVTRGRVELAARAGVPAVVGVVGVGAGVGPGRLEVRGVSGIPGIEVLGIGATMAGQGEDL